MENEKVVENPFLFDGAVPVIDKGCVPRMRQDDIDRLLGGRWDFKNRTERGVYLMPKKEVELCARPLRLELIRPEEMFSNEDFRAM